MGFTMGRIVRMAAIATALSAIVSVGAFAQSNSSQSPWSDPNGPLSTNGASVSSGQNFGNGPGFGPGPAVTNGQSRNGMMRGFGGNGGFGNFGDDNQGNFGPGRPGFGSNGMGPVRGFGPGNGPGNGPAAGIDRSRMIRGGGPDYIWQEINGGQQISPDHVSTIVSGFLSRFATGSYRATQVLEFQNAYYVQVADSSGNKPAFELIVNAYSGAVHFSPATMMWNTSIGRAQFSLRGNIGQASVTATQATKDASDYVKQVSSNATVSAPVAYPGYYAFVVSDSGKTVGVLDVDGFSGRVWYQNWNGAFVKSVQ